MAGTKPSAPPLVMAALVLFVFLFVFFLYTFLHEGGHALAGLFFGQSLTEFDVSFWDFSAHVGMAGGELTQGQRPIKKRWRRRNLGIAYSAKPSFTIRINASRSGTIFSFNRPAAMMGSQLFISFSVSGLRAR